MASAETRTTSWITPDQFRSARRTGSRVNLSDPERWGCVIGGGALAVFGLSRESLPGLGLAALGGTLVY
jgi:uncharacterized membrane protein